MSVLLRSLLDPQCYPHPVAHVRLIETHISWLLLTGTYAYKVKKPVKLPFVDFATLDRRHHYCLEELRLNRRFAPDLYLEVVPITGSPERPSIGGSGAAIEFAVKMREFPQDALLDRRLEQGRLAPQDIDAVADAFARIHAAAPVADAPYARHETLLAPALANFSAVRACANDAGMLEPVAELEAWTRAEHARCQSHFAARRQAGRIRDCHGDLHLGNIAWLDGRPALFDCIEFDDALRQIDVMSEIGFTVMDLHARKRADLGQRLLNGYLEASGDYAGLAVLAFYLVYRALVRAKIHCIRANQPDVSADARALECRNFVERLVLAQSLAQRPQTFLAITCGLSGSGKTHASQHIVEATRAIRIRSDVERKRLHGLAPDEASASAMGGGIYTPHANDRTFERLAELSRTVVGAGYPVIIDASFLRRERRAAFRALAAELGVPFAIVHCRADEDVLATRILQRQAESRDASEATLDVLAEQKRFAHPLDEEERAIAVQVDNTDPDSMRALPDRLNALCRGR